MCVRHSWSKWRDSAAWVNRAFSCTRTTHFRRIFSSIYHLRHMYITTTNRLAKLPSRKNTRQLFVGHHRNGEYSRNKFMELSRTGFRSLRIRIGKNASAVSRPWRRSSGTFSSSLENTRTRFRMTCRPEASSLLDFLSYTRARILARRIIF